VFQWVLSLPKRLRYFLRHIAHTVTGVLKIFLRVVELLQHQCRLSVYNGHSRAGNARSVSDPTSDLGMPVVYGLLPVAK